MSPSLLVVAILAGVAGAAIAWLMARRRAAEDATATVDALASLRRDNEWLRERAARDEQTTAQLRDTFQALAADALNANRAAFLDLARTTFDGFHQQASLQFASREQALNDLVRPIGDALKQVDTKLAQTERERLDAYARLTEQLAALGSSTASLSRALWTPAVRGRWGELQLRRVIEMAGMLRHCDFAEQTTLQADGGRLRPDVIVHLPGDKQIVIDAKAPLEAFLDAQEATDDAQRQTLLQTHARHVRDHMDRLGAKSYWEQLPGSPDMVVMFLPGETLFSNALQQDLTLIDHGVRQRVLLASPITLIALLTTVAHAWRQEALAENYRDVALLGRDLHDRLLKFVTTFDDLRKRLDGAVQAYNSAAGSLEARVLVTARRLKDLKVTTAPELPPVESIDTIPRVLKQAGLMGLPDDATVHDTEPV